MNIGTLVKEKEGAKTAGIILEVFEYRKRKHVKVLWPSGEKKVYKSTFLEPAYD